MLGWMRSWSAGVLAALVGCSDAHPDSSPAFPGQQPEECREALGFNDTADVPRLNVEIYNRTTEPRWLASSHMCGEHYAVLRQSSLPPELTAPVAQVLTCVELLDEIIYEDSDGEIPCDRPRVAGLSPTSWLTEDRKPLAWETVPIHPTCEFEDDVPSCKRVDVLPPGRYELSILVGTTCQLIGGGPCEPCYSDDGETCRLEDAIVSDAREVVVPFDLPRNEPVIVELVD